MINQTMIPTEASKKLPPGPYNTGLVIELLCSCPPSCVCQSNEPRNWKHKSCKDQSYINEFGDIFCKNYKDRPECEGYFIQHAKFQCSKAKQNNQWHQFNSASQFLMSIAQGLQAAEFSLNEVNLEKFARTLNETVIQRWNN